MAISFHTNASSGGSTSASTTGTCTNLVTTVGDLILVCIGTINTTISSVTDSATPANSYSPATIFIANASSVSCQVWKAWAQSTATIATITATFGSSRWGMIAASYSGVPQTLDFAATNTSSSATPSLSVLTESNNNWLVTGFGVRGSTSITQATGIIRTVRPGGGTTSPGIALVDLIRTVTGVDTNSITITSAAWAATGIELNTSPFMKDRWGQEEPVIWPISVIPY